MTTSKPTDEAEFPPVDCSDSSTEDYIFDEECPIFCHFCGGEGMVEGSEMGDPLWYDVDQFHECPCCNGSGMADDCTFW